MAPRSAQAFDLAKVALIAYATFKVLDLAEGFLPKDPPPGPQDAPKPTNPDGTVMEPTLQPVQLLSMANAIESAVPGLWEDEDEAVRQLKRCRNLADVHALITAFGERQLRQPLGPLVALPAAVALYLEPEEIRAVNLFYFHMGIDFTF